MLVAPRLVPFLLLEAGILSVAVRLWLEFRRDDKRRRIAKSVETVLSSEQFSRPEKTPLKRAA